MEKHNVQFKKVWKQVTLFDQLRFMFSSYYKEWRYAIVMHKVEGNKFLILHMPGEVACWKKQEYNATIFPTLKRANYAYSRLFGNAPDVEIIMMKPVKVKE